MTQNKPSFKEEVIIPTGKAIIFGGFSALTAIAILRARHTPNDAWGIVFGLVISSASFWILAWRPIPNLDKNPLTTDEVQTFAEQVEITLIDKTEPNYTKGKFIKTRLHPDKLIRLARHLGHGGKFSGTELGGKGLLFSRADYEKLRKDFVDGGFIRWKNPVASTVGLELTIGGRAFVRHYSKLKTTIEQTSPLLNLHPQKSLIHPSMQKHIQTRINQ